MRVEETHPGAVSAFKELKNQFAMVYYMCSESKPPIYLHLISS